jgi:hypothetical protein
MKKLRLNSEVLRRLTPEESRQVVGGLTAAQDCTANTMLKCTCGTACASACPCTGTSDFTVDVCPTRADQTCFYTECDQQTCAC